MSDAATAVSCIERVLVAIDLRRQQRENIEYAARIAKACQAELSALLVEDANLIASGELPFTCEIDRLLATHRKLETARLARWLQIQTDHARAVIERIACERNLRLSFQVVRGDYLRAAAAAAAPTDILLLGQAHSDLLLPSQPSHAGKTKQRCIGLYLLGNRGVERVLSMAEQLMQADEDLSLLAITDQALIARAGNLYPKNASPDLARLRRMRFAHASAQDLATVAKCVRAAGCELLILPRAASTVALQLVDRINCPMVLVP